jgi:hypothetical protein
MMIVVQSYLAVNSVGYTSWPRRRLCVLLSDAPLLLNARWTVSEMADALQIQPRESPSVDGTLEKYDSCTNHHLETTIFGVLS